MSRDAQATRQYPAWDAVKLFDGNKAVANVPVWKGQTAEVALGAADPGGVFVTVPKGEGAQVKTVIERTDPLVAPLAKGQRVGTIKVTSASGAALASVPLVVQQPVELAGIFGRAWDAMRLWLK